MATNKWTDLVFAAIQRIVEGWTSRSVWLLIIASGGVWYLMHVRAGCDDLATCPISEDLLKWAMGTWGGAFLIAAAKRGATTVASMRNGGNGK